MLYWNMSRSAATKEKLRVVVNEITIIIIIINYKIMTGQTAVLCCSQTKHNYDLNNDHCKRKL